jgi:hypothetical protein
VGTAYVAAELEAVSIASDTTLPDLVLRDGVELSGRVLAPGGAPAVAVDVDVRDASTGDSLVLGGDRTDAAGIFTTFVPPGTWDVVFTPPALSGWGPARRDAVAVAGATDLGDVPLPGATTATVAAVLPADGPERGGTVVEVRGAGFVAGARVSFGGRPLKGVEVLDPQTLRGTTRSHHRGVVDVTVVNPGAVPAVLSGGFAYRQEAPEPLLRVRRDGPFGADVLLEWSPVDGPGFLVLRSDAPWDFGLDRVVRATGRTSWRDEGAALVGGLSFYVVH